ncbi:MAG: phospholipase [Pseudonocardiales bacterium]|jgi:phospholipase C|nr:phospholipase [Pseudonocardiales bacterium]
MKRLLAVVVLTLAVATPGAVAAARPAAADVPSPAATQHAPVTPISHLVVMTQDQHSFDNYFGARPGVDGLPTGVCVPVKIAAARPCVRPFPVPSGKPGSQLRTTVAAERTSVDQGRMDGFVQAQTRRTSDGTAAMGYYRPSDIPTLSQLADRAVVFDRWFSGVPGGTIPNRLFAVTARTTTAEGEVPTTGWVGMPTIFDELTAAGVSWRIYVENYEHALTLDTASTKSRSGGQIARVPVLAMRRYLDNPALLGHVRRLDDYYVDLATGKLPAVAYVVSTASTEHPPSSPTAGQALARTVVNSLIASSAWPSSAFLLNYDSSGGWYDHVAPPTVNGAQLGLRVPALLMSPYTSPGTVDHTQYDSAATLGFIEHNWTLAPLTARDRDAGDLSTAFAFNRRPAPAALVVPSGERPAIRQPHSATLYIGYGLALAAGAGVLAWTLAGERRRRRVKVNAA